MSISRKDLRGVEPILKQHWLVTLVEESEAMIIEANHRRICWAHEHNDQSALFKNLLNSAQIFVGNGRLKNVSTEWYRGRYFWQH